MKLTLLHLSDLHFESSQWKDSRIIFDGLLRDLKKLHLEEGLNPDLILFSGDMVNGGGETADFNALEQNIIIPLLECTSLTKNELIVSPGNHDIDREKVRKNPAVQAGLLQILKDRSSCNEFFDAQTDGEPDNFYFSRLEAFSKYSIQFGQEHRLKRTSFFETFVVPIWNVRVGVAALNTAWLSTGEPDDRDRGRLIVPEHAIYKALEDLADCRFKIAILHHPLDYLAEHNRFDCKTLLLKDFNLVCTGHQHRPMPESLHSPIGESICSEAGALYASRSRHNGYCFIIFDLTARKVDFLHRRWEDSPGLKFAEDNAVSEHGRSSFDWGNLNEVQRIRRLLDVNSALKPLLVEQANEHMLSAHTTTNAPKSFEEIYVDIPVTDQSSYESFSLKKPPKYLSVTDILKSDKPVIIYGGRETGKTTLGYQLCLRVCDGSGGTVRVPIFADLDVSTKDALAREAKRTLGLAQLQGQYEDLCSSGSFVFVLDNFRIADLRKLNLISGFIERYPRNLYVLISDESVGMIRSHSTDQPGFDHIALYIRPLKRPAVRELTRRWLSPSGLYSRDTFHTVLKKIETSNLPATAYVVSMIAWTIEKQSPLAIINEASLLERFIDGILNKADPKEVSRSSMDFTIKDTFLSELSHKMVDEQSYIIDKNELVTFTIDFIKVRSWKHDAVSFVEELIQTGVLLCVGTSIAFRYRCLREFFLARYMILHDDYRDEVLSKERYLLFSREIDIYTGLRRRDSDIVRKLLEYTDELAIEGLSRSDLSLFDKTTLNFGGEHNLVKVPDSLVELGITDEVVEKMLDEQEDRIAQSKQSTDLEGENAQDAVSRLKGFMRCFQSIVLLSKVIRNSELMTDAELKRMATESVVKHWSSLICLLLESFEQATSGETGDGEARKQFESLTPQIQSYVEHFVKVVLPVITTRVVYENLGTEKLRSIFESLLSEDQPLLMKVILAFLLLDLTSNEHSETGSAIKNVEKFIKGHGTRYLNEVISMKLLTIYYSPNIGKTNRERIEGIYAETQLKARGLSSGKINSSSTKNRIMESLRQKRGQIVKGEEPTDGG